MKREDDLDELRHLSNLLGEIGACLSSSEHERALKIAGLALHAAFMEGKRGQLESEFEALGAPLTESQREHLRSVGIDPDAP
jgi:hypothetical protein